MEHRPWKTIFAENKKAFFDYELIEEYEAGVKLLWEEVKSVRNGNINLKGSYILINKSVATMIGVHIGELKGGMRLIEPKRERDILLSKKEIQKLQLKVKEMGATIVPISFYAKWNLIKVRIALVKGKKTWQKKESIKARDLDREMAQKFKR
jgi:SsrA-binding protein